MSNRLFIVTVLGCLSSCLAAPEAPPDVGDRSLAVGSMQPVTSFGSNPAQLKMYAYVPSNLPAGPRPLVVAMHGCSQTASAYVSAGWNDLAEQLGVYVVYPEQNTGVNNGLGCFNWGGSWDSAPSTFVFNEPLHLQDLERGHAENQSIKEMVDYMKATYDIDAGRVYASGLSAGGGFTAVMLATWPDVFAGGIIVAGIPYGCTIVPNATTQQGSDCIRAHPETHQLNRTAAAWGDLVRAANPGYDGPYPKVSIWHGDADYTVAFGVMNEIVEQWTDVHGIDMQPDQTETISGATRSEYRDESGQALVETWVIPQMGHGQPVDSGEACGQGGAFFSDVGVCAAARGLAFIEPDGSGGGSSPDAGTGGGGGGGGGGGYGPDGGPGGGGVDGPGDQLDACACRGGGSPAGTLALVGFVALLLAGRGRLRSRLLLAGRGRLRSRLLLAGRGRLRSRLLLAGRGRLRSR